jgi:hypothetical protein
MQSTQNNGTVDLDAIHKSLLGELNRFAEHFDGSDKAKVRGMIASMLRKLGRMRTSNLSQELKDLKAFAWKTHFPGRVPIFVVKRLTTPKVLEWRNEIAMLERDFMEVFQFSHDCDTETFTSEMIRKFNRGTLNEIQAVAGDTPHPILHVPADDLDSASEMSPL